jgi:SPASM domain peptide maturase of grasp-with-spasm system
MKYFKIFSNCTVTRGFTRSLISDLQRGTSEFIPNSMAEVIVELNSNIPINSIYAEYGDENKETIKEYIDFLERKDLGFYCDNEDIKRFSALNESFKTPSHITNIVIEIKKDEIFRLKEYINSLNLLLCRNVCLVFYENLEMNDYLLLNSFFEESIVENIEIINLFDNFINNLFLEKLSKEFNKLTRVTIFQSPFEKVILWNNNILMDVVFLTKSITNFKFCGGVSADYFNVNLNKYLEAVNHNSCLHKKLGIDINGNIKNCPAMSQSFGNTKDIALEEAINHEAFKKYWNLTKNEIEICKDCEFRHVCTDCRAYTEQSHTNKEGLDTSKPLKCGYDPYTGEWEEWSTNPLKQKAIQHYGMENLIKK